MYKIDHKTIESTHGIVIETANGTHFGVPPKWGDFDGKTVMMYLILVGHNGIILDGVDVGIILDGLYDAHTTSSSHFQGVAAMPTLRQAK